MSDGEIGLTFGQVAEEYDRLRPGYPPEAVAWLSGRVGGRRALEIGAGTGKATVEFLRAGFMVTALEPDQAMAAVGRARVPGAEWIVAAAETWPVALGAFDLVYGAQSWHWVDEGSDARLAAALGADGAMAWIWNHPDLGLEKERFGDLYARFMPGPTSRREANHRRDPNYWRDRMARVLPEVETYETTWARRMSAADYVDLIATYSDHIVLPPEDRMSLQDGIRRRLMDSGGAITLGYVTRVYLGSRL